MADSLSSFTDIVKNRKSNKDLSSEKKESIYASLLSHSKNGKLPHGILSKLARFHGVDRTTVSSVWSKARADLSNPNAEAPDFTNLRAAGRTFRSRRAHGGRFLEMARQMDLQPIRERDPPGRTTRSPGPRRGHALGKIFYDDRISWRFAR